MACVPKNSEQEHERLIQLARARNWRSPPARPVASECCGGHCDPCIWDYYDRALWRWRERHGA